MEIKLEIKFNGANDEMATFVNEFKQDLSYCLTRFNHNSKWVNAEADYQFVALANKDFSNQKFVEEINLDKLDKTCILILIDNISSQTSFSPLFTSYLFWDEISETNEMRPFKKQDTNVKNQYWERITDIAVEISERNTAYDYTPENTIYLAQTSNTQMSEWLNIKRDLNDIGSRVLPSKLLSTNIEECTTQITNDIKHCGIIIHLIPIAYSKYFSNSHLSIAEHQLNISSKYMAENPGKAKRIIWIPSDYEYTDEKNQIFIERIQRDQDQSNDTTILKVNLEDLKQIYRKILAGVDVKSNKEELPELYLISDEVNRVNTDKLNIPEEDKKLKLGSNFDNISYNEHLRYLANAQVVVLNYNNENEQWINVKVNDILKSPGLKTSKPNKKLILIKKDKTLNTKQFESIFDEVQIIGDIQLDVKH